MSTFSDYSESLEHYELYESSQSEFLRISILPLNLLSGYRPSFPILTGTNEVTVDSPGWLNLFILTGTNDLTVDSPGWLNLLFLTGTNEVTVDSPGWPKLGTGVKAYKLINGESRLGLFTGRFSNK